MNAGTETIPVAYWDLVDDYKAMDLVSQQSRFRNRQRPTVFDDPVKAPTKIKGLRAAETPAIAWRTVEQTANKKEADATKVPMFSFAKASSLDGAVADGVRSGLLPDEDVAVFDHQAAQGNAPVSDSVSLPIGSVRSISDVLFKDRATPYTTLFVKVNSVASSDQVKVFSPFLSALRKGPKETATFLELISRFAREPDPIVSTSDIRDEELWGPSFDFKKKFYVVEHPLTIEWLALAPDGKVTSSVQCIRIASYSPFPVSLNDKFCVR